MTNKPSEAWSDANSNTRSIKIITGKTITLIVYVRDVAWEIKWLSGNNRIKLPTHQQRTLKIAYLINDS
jgi:hypothetical protein